MNNIANSDSINGWSKVPEDTLVKFGEFGDFGRQYLLNPALFKLLGDVNNKKILDAGCGQGYLSRLLAKRGAKMTAVEPADSLINYAKKLELTDKLGIEYIQEDLSLWKSSTNNFDVVISNMVFMDVPDYQTAIHNCITALKTGGQFVFSISHPCFFDGSNEEWNKNKYVLTKEYFKEYSTKPTYGYSFHRTLSTYINFVINEGCTIKEIIEPQLPEEIALQNPDWSKDVHVPTYFVVSATKN